MTTLMIDGAQGEGGGQILRTALTLSMLTQRPLVVERIRAGRSKPGLLRQHLTAVQAAARISNAQVEGAALGSTHVAFQPGAVQGGQYEFDIGSAGSCTLVLQTLLPALWFADTPTHIRVRGGTHNPLAPSADFLMRAWNPLLARLGIHQQFSLGRHGFYPAGGGCLEVQVKPGAPQGSLHLEAEGPAQLYAEAWGAAIPAHVAQRELHTLGQCLSLQGAEAHELPRDQGPGNVLTLEVRRNGFSTLLTALGQRRLRAEQVARDLAHEVQQLLDSGAALDEHLADQILLPMALAGGGAFTCVCVSGHLRTQAELIQAVLPVQIAITPVGRAHQVRVGAQP